MVFLLEFLGEGSRHDDSSDVAGGGEVSLASLAAVRGDVYFAKKGGKLK